MPRFMDDELKELLERLHDKYNRSEFIEDDPISVPHRYTDRADREIAGFLAATIAWGNRRAIVTSGHRMMRCMDDAPADFVRNASDRELATLETYVHRTFHGRDLRDFVLALRRMDRRFGGLGVFFEERYAAAQSIPAVLSEFRREFFSCDHAPRCEKHLSSIDRGAACKRLCMFLRWMVRRDERTSASGRGFRCRPFTFRSTSIRATWPARWACFHAARTTGGPWRRSRRRFADSIPPIPCATISRFSAPASTVI